MKFCAWAFERDLSTSVIFFDTVSFFGIDDLDLRFFLAVDILFLLAMGDVTLVMPACVIGVRLSWRWLRILSGWFSWLACLLPSIQVGVRQQVGSCLYLELFVL